MARQKKSTLTGIEIEKGVPADNTEQNLIESNVGYEADISRGRELVDNLTNSKKDDVFLSGNIKIAGDDGALLWWAKGDFRAQEKASKQEEFEKKQFIREIELNKIEIIKNNESYRLKLESEKKRFDEERKKNKELYKQQERERHLSRELKEAELERERLRQEEAAQEEQKELLRQQDELEIKRQEEIERRAVKEHELKLTQLQKQKEIEAQKQRMKADEAEAGVHERQLALEAEKKETEKLIAREQELIENLNREYKQMYSRAEEQALERQKHAALMSDYAAMSEEKRIADLKRLHNISDVAFLPYRKDYGSFGADNIIEVHEISLIGAENGKVLVNKADFNIASTGITAITGYKREEIDGIISVLLRDFEKPYIISSGELRYDGETVTDVKRADYHAQIRDCFYVVPNFIDRKKNFFLTAGNYLKSLIGEYDREKAIELLSHFDVRNPLKLLSRSVTKCSLSELNKIYLTGAFLTMARVVVLAEPQRYLDCVTRLALLEKIRDWNKTNPSQALVIFTSDKAIFEVNTTLIRRIGK